MVKSPELSLSKLTTRQRALLVIDRLLDSDEASTAEIAQLLRVRNKAARRAMWQAQDLLRCLRRAILGIDRHGVSLTVTREGYYHNQTESALKEKRAIARAIVEGVDGRPPLVDEWDALYLGLGTTVTHLAEAIADRQLPCVVMTNSLGVLDVLAPCRSAEVYCSGGKLDRGQGGFFGERALDGVQGFHPSKIALGTSGISFSSDGQVMYSTDEETTLIEMVVQQGCRTLIIPTDAAKIGKRDAFALSRSLADLARDMRVVIVTAGEEAQERRKAIDEYRRRHDLDESQLELIVASAGES